MTAVGPDLDLGRRPPELRVYPDAPRMFDAGSDTVQPAAAVAATRSRSARRAIPPCKGSARAQLHGVTALTFWNAAVRATGIDPGGIYTQHELSLRVIFGLHGERSGDRSTGTSIGFDVVSDRDSAKLDGGEEIKKKSP